MTDPRIDQFLNGLGPIMRVEGESPRWTLAERAAHYRVPATSVAVMENGRIAWAAATGPKESGRPGQVDTQTMFAGASISKPPAAVLVLQLVEQGLVDLDVAVNRYLKRWQLPDNAFTAEAPVTLRWLLSHKAGTTVHGFGGAAVGEPAPTIIDTLEGRAPATTPPVRVDKRPGGAERYSGGGTTIVQLLLEDVTGKAFADLATERVFGPLGMTRSTYVQPLPEALRDNAASGHDAEGAVWPGRWVSTPQLAAGGIYTTPSDYARFLLGCREAWLGVPGAILGRGLAREMMTPQSQSTFGLGFEIFQRGEAMRFGHGGSNGGNQCDTTCFLESGDGAVVMTNGDAGSIMYWEVFSSIAEVQGWQHFLRPAVRVTPLDDRERAELVGRYVIGEGDGDFAIRVFEQDGELMSTIDGMRNSTHRMRRGDDGRLFGERGPYDSEIVRDAAGRITGFIVRRDGVTEVMRPRRV